LYQPQHSGPARPRAARARLAGTAEA